MKTIAALSLIFSCSLSATWGSYSSDIERIWAETQAKVDAVYVSGLESTELAEKLTAAAKMMRPKESLLLNFYPKGSGFDQLIGEEFLDIKDLNLLAEELGLEIAFSYPQRHLAHFRDADELRAFVQQQFKREIALEHYPLTFLTKIVTVKLIKRDTNS